tara:strand:- start:634 stop:1134 length:501 start_codon:yes stop_codon:yes gene_type:complete
MTRYAFPALSVGQLQQTEPIEEPKPIPDPSMTELSVAGPFDPFSGGQGIMGGEPIRRYLAPILQQVGMKNLEELRNKIDPYVQEVQQLTDQTFPDLNLSGGGLRGGLGSIFGVGMGGPAVDFPAVNFMNYNMDSGPEILDPIQVSNTMQSSPNKNPSPFGTASFFR